jgi:hypothetical protein
MGLREEEKRTCDERIVAPLQGLAARMIDQGADAGYQKKLV